MKLWHPKVNGIRLKFKIKTKTLNRIFSYWMPNFVIPKWPKPICSVFTKQWRKRLVMAACQERFASVTNEMKRNERLLCCRVNCISLNIASIIMYQLFTEAQSNACNVYYSIYLHKSRKFPHYKLLKMWLCDLSFSIAVLLSIESREKKNCILLDQIRICIAMSAYFFMQKCLWCELTETKRSFSNIFGY